MATKLRLKMLIIIDNMYIEESFFLNNYDHEICTHNRIDIPLLYGV